MSYSGDPATSPKDEVRFLIRDTDEANELLTDVEIQYLVDIWLPKYDSILMVAAAAADQIATAFAGVVDVSADGVSVGTSRLSQAYAELALRLRAQHKAAAVGGTVDLSNLMVGTTFDESIEPMVFGVGIHDNHAAGQQSYGGRRINPWEQAERRANSG